MDEETNIVELLPQINLRDDKESGSHLGGVQSNHFLRGEQTGGAYSLSELTFQPGSQGTPLHVHHREEELYYVIEGELQVVVGGEETVLGVGASVRLPRGIPHKVWPVGNVATRVLMIVSPPQIIEMLLELDRLNAQGRLDLPAMQRWAAEYRVVLLPGKKI